MVLRVSNMVWDGVFAFPVSGLVSPSCLPSISLVSSAVFGLVPLLFLSCPASNTQNASLMQGFLDFTVWCISVPLWFDHCQKLWDQACGGHWGKLCFFGRLQQQTWAAQFDDNGDFWPLASFNDELPLRRYWLLVMWRPRVNSILSSIPTT